MRYLFNFLMLFSLNGLSAQTIDSITIKQIDSLLLVAKDFTDQGDFTSAMNIISSTEITAGNKLGKETASFASILFRKAKIYEAQKNPEEAEKCFLETQKLQKVVMGRNNPSYALTIANMAFFYKNINRYKQAEELYLEVVEIREVVYGATSPEFAGGLINLGLIYADTDRFEDAEKNYLKAKDIFENQRKDK